MNTKIPNFEGLHDLGYIDLPPHRKPTLIQRVDDRIGLTSLPIDPEKIIGIVGMQSPLLIFHLGFLLFTFVS